MEMNVSVEPVPLGGLGLSSVEEVQRWAEVHGGEDAVRLARANDQFFACAGMVDAWLRLQEDRRSRLFAQASLEAAQRSAAASERAATFSMWSAVIATVTAAVAVAAILYGQLR